MPYPDALHVMARTTTTPAPATVVFVHGSLDRGDSFRRVMRRLPDLSTVAYDRRGYQGSRAGGVVDLGGHVDDLLQITATVRAESGRPVVAIGHSLGGDVVVGAALAEPRAFSAVGAYEPPMPWLGFRRETAQGPGAQAQAQAQARAWPPLSSEPADEVEHFFSRMVSASAWERLSEAGRAERRADGPALMADLRSLHGEGPPFEVTELDVPAVFGMGGPTTRPHHRRTVEWLGTHVPGCAVYEIEGAQHGAHLSHPDHFAAMTRVVLDRVTDASA